MKNINEVTLFGSKCPKCGHENSDKHVSFSLGDTIENIEKKEREAVRCESCGYDIYEHTKNGLDIE